VSFREAGRRPSSDDEIFAVLNGVGVAAVVAHLAAWPHRRSAFGLPLLTDCEGLGPEPIPPYNAILYVGGAFALAALVGENRSASPWAWLALAAAPLLAALQPVEFRRRCDQARARPRWWNRRLQTRTLAS
jgi:hypothetical protein